MNILDKIGFSVVIFVVSLFFYVVYTTHVENMAKIESGLCEVRK